MRAGFLIDHATTPPAQPSIGLLANIVDVDPRMGNSIMAVAPVGYLATKSDLTSSEIAIGSSAAMVVPENWDDLSKHTMHGPIDGKQVDLFGAADGIAEAIADAMFDTEHVGDLIGKDMKGGFRIPSPFKAKKMVVATLPQEVLAFMSTFHLEKVTTEIQRYMNDFERALSKVHFDIVPIGLGIVGADGKYVKRPTYDFTYGTHQARLNQTRISMPPFERRRRFAATFLLARALKRMVVKWAALSGGERVSPSGWTEDDWMAWANFMVHAYGGSEKSVERDEVLDGRLIQDVIPSFIGLPFAFGYPWVQPSGLHDPSDETALAAWRSVLALNVCLGLAVTQVGGIVTDVSINHEAGSNQTKTSDFERHFRTDVTLGSGNQPLYMHPAALNGITTGFLAPSPLEGGKVTNFELHRVDELGDASAFQVADGKAVLPQDPQTRGLFRAVMFRDGGYGIRHDIIRGDMAIIKAPAGQVPPCGPLAVMMTYLSDPTTMPGSVVKVQGDICGPEYEDFEGGMLMFTREYLPLGVQPFDAGVLNGPEPRDPKETTKAEELRGEDGEIIKKRPDPVPAGRGRRAHRTSTKGNDSA